jgi:hypothetical protein
MLSRPPPAAMTMATFGNLSSPAPLSPSDDASCQLYSGAAPRFPRWRTVAALPGDLPSLPASRVPPGAVPPVAVPHGAVPHGARGPQPPRIGACGPQAPNPRAHRAGRVAHNPRVSGLVGPKPQTAESKPQTATPPGPRPSPRRLRRPARIQAPDGYAARPAPKPQTATLPGAPAQAPDGHAARPCPAPGVLRRHRVGAAPLRKPQAPRTPQGPQPAVASRRAA